jgi:PucR C-terminal helix-turn-helix domain
VLSIAEVGVCGEAETTWTELGSWRTVAVLAQGYTNNPADLVPLIHPGILSLIREGRGDLVHTLDVYLGHGGDARKTAATLHLHRSSLYYRLEKLSEAVGGDLHDGDARFELRLGIRLAYLARIYPTQDLIRGWVVLKPISLCHSFFRLVPRRPAWWPVYSGWAGGGRVAQQSPRGGGCVS